MRKLLLLSLLILGACAPVTNPVTDGPGVSAPSPSDTESRTILITQRAPGNTGLQDVNLSLLARTDEGMVKIDVQGNVSSPAYLDDVRCVAVPGSELASCALGDLGPDTAAAPVAITLAPGVRLQCASYARTSNSFSDLTPLLCRSVVR